MADARGTPDVAALLEAWRASEALWRTAAAALMAFHPIEGNAIEGANIVADLSKTATPLHVAGKALAEALVRVEAARQQAEQECVRLGLERNAVAVERNDAQRLAEEMRIAWFDRAPERKVTFPWEVS